MYLLNFAKMSYQNDKDL